MAKIVAIFNLYSPGGKHLGNWKEVPIAAVPAVGMLVVLKIGAKFASPTDPNAPEFSGYGMELNDYAQFLGHVREIRQCTYHPCGELLVNIKVEGEIQ